MGRTVHVRAAIDPEQVARARSTGSGVEDRPWHQAPWQQDEQGHHYTPPKKAAPVGAKITLSFCQDSQVSVRTLKFACQDSQVCVRTAPSGRFRRGRARSKGGLGVYHSLLGGRGRRVAVKEGGGLVGGTCEHCEDRAPSGPRQDSVRTLSGLCQDSVRTLSGLSGQLRELHKPGWGCAFAGKGP